MLIALSGPSGIGKGFIKQALLARYPEITELAWLTTRPLREGELAGGNRIHVSRTCFATLEAQGKCVLVQELYGNRYGLLSAQLHGTQPRLTEMHPGNVQEIIRLHPNIYLIGLVTDDLSLLHDRLVIRGDVDQKNEERLDAAKAEMSLIHGMRHLYNFIFIITRENESEMCGHVLNTIGGLLNITSEGVS